MTAKDLMISLAESAYLCNMMQGFRPKLKPGELYQRLTTSEQRLLLQELRSQDLALIRQLPMNDGPKTLRQLIQSYQR